MVDTHFHLDHIDAPPAHVVSRARKAGVDRMLAIGMTGESCRHALAAADAHEEIYVSVGRHPHESEGFDDAGLDELRELSAHPKARAVGEAGLDYKRDYAPRDDQRRSFVAQIELAKSLGRPLVVHTREAADDTIGLLDQHGHGVAVIIHCFSLADRVQECVERRWYCSFAGNVTYPKATDLQRAAAEVPDDLLLAETDAPFLSPQERRSKPNEPAYVTATSRYLAKLRDTSVEEMEGLLVRNAARLFGW
ncbi:MAG TPA: TatD family hydrolase [Solirubrobacterales bacterium]|nr:TatD family hydrolase [Solirubrobacterales bacterium]